MLLKRKVLTLVFITCFFFGLSLVTTVQATSDPGYPITITGTLPHNLDPNQAWFTWIPLFLDAGRQVHMKLTLIDPVPPTDPDIYVSVPGIEGWVWIGGVGWTGSPVAEEGYFYTPVADTYQIGLYNYYIPDPAGTDYELFIDVGDLIDPYPPVESNGLTVGELTSYINNHENAKARASENAAFNKVPPVYDSAIIGFHNLPFTAYTLPQAAYCASDPLAVGGFVWYQPAYYFETLKEAKEYMSGADYEFSIDGIPLSDLTRVSDEKFKPYYHGGERIGYLLYSSTGIFKPGELADLIDEGKHTLYTEITYFGNLIFYNIQEFWLMPEGSTGP